MSAPSPHETPRRGLWESVKPFLSRPVLVVIALGFASGLPLSLIFDTLSVWLRDEDLSLSSISYFSLVTFSYSLKFVWAPVLDRVRLPGLTALLGHRRGWILASQLVIILGLWTISGLDPRTQLGWMALAAAVIGFAGASQDIVIDAWRIETAGPSETRQAIMAAAWSWGARISPFVSGIVPLVLAETLGWGFAYALMAALMGVGVLAVLLAPKEAEHRVRPIEYGDVPPAAGKEAWEWAARLFVMFAAICLLGAGLTANIDLFRPIFPTQDAFDAAKAAWTSRTSGIFLQFPAVLLGLGLLVVACLPAPGTRTRPGAYLRQTFVAPVLAFFDRYDRVAWLLLATICLYRVSDFLLNVNGAFYVDLGFDLSTIAEVRKVFGVIMTMIGVAIGGVVMARFGTRTALLFGAVVGSFSNLAYGWLATQGDDVFAFAIALGVDNVSGGIAGTVLIAFMSSLITPGYAAQQYALFTSLYALPGKLLASQSGRIVEAAAQAADAGWGGFMRAWFAALPATAYQDGAAGLGVAPEALGAGYVVFYFYSSVIGVLAIALALWLVRRQDFLDALRNTSRPEEEQQPA